MQRHTATEFGRLVNRVEEKTLQPARLNIGSRLIFCFVFIILVMLSADAVVLWQFHLVNAQGAPERYRPEAGRVVTRSYQSLSVLRRVGRTRADPRCQSTGDRGRAPWYCCPGGDAARKNRPQCPAFRPPARSHRPAYAAGYSERAATAA